MDKSEIVKNLKQIKSAQNKIEDIEKVQYRSNQGRSSS